MARSISQAQLHFLEGNDIDLMGESQQSFQPIKLNDLADTLTYLAALYTEKLADSLNKADATSSGFLADSIIPLDVKVFGSVYTVEIQAATYAKFIDEGVDGWAKARGSKYKFKTKGVDPNGEMVKSIKAWLLREGSFSRNVSTQLSKRESRQKTITDASTKLSKRESRQKTITDASTKLSKRESRQKTITDASTKLSKRESRQKTITDASTKLSKRESRQKTITDASTKLSKRESRQKTITDASTKQAISTAYMIKRQGIRPTKFYRNTTKDMARVVEMELAKALKVDIINSIVE